MWIDPIRLYRADSRAWIDPFHFRATFSPCRHYSRPRFESKIWAQHTNVDHIFSMSTSGPCDIYLLFGRSSLLFCPCLEIHARSARLLFTIWIGFNCWHFIFHWWISNRKILYSRIVSKHGQLVNNFRGYCTENWHKCQSIIFKTDSIFHAVTVMAVTSHIFSTEATFTRTLNVKLTSKNCKHKKTRPKRSSADFCFSFRNQINYRKLCTFGYHLRRFRSQNVSD